MGIPNGKYLNYEAVMKGSIHSDQVCPVCGSKFKSSDSKRGLFCPNHPKIKPTSFRVYFDKIYRRFDNYESALNFLSGLRFEASSGKLDPRDFQTKTKPLAFSKLAAEWLDLKASQIKASSLTSFRSGIMRVIDAWGRPTLKTSTLPKWRIFSRFTRAPPRPS